MISPDDPRLKINRINHRIFLLALQNLALGALLCWAAKRQREHDFEMRMTCEFCSNEKTFCTCYLDNLQDKENK